MGATRCWQRIEKIPISGFGTARIVDESDDSHAKGKTLVAQVGGVNVHADRVIDGRDRPQLERLCRYAASTDCARAAVAARWTRAIRNETFVVRRHPVTGL